MLGDTELQGLDTQISKLGLASRKHHNTVQDLMSKCQNLLENYRSLKSDYEEEKELREKYKKLVRGQERDPFVLVLVDGDGYIFKDQLIKNRAEGGITAAQLLSNSIKDVLPRLGSDADQYRVMVRIYANLAGLSNTLARAGLVGNDSRSIAPFIAGFNRSQDLFDFVDAGDKKEGADFKIREMFRLFADNSQCKHIFFAGCHDAGYLSLLTPYRSKGDQITLIKSASFHPEYHTLDLPVVELPYVFRSNALNGITLPSTNKHPLSLNIKDKVVKPFQKEKYGFGDQYSKQYSIPGGHGFEASDNSTDRRGLLSSVHSPSPVNQYSPTFSRIQALLPVFLPEYEGLIPINKNRERIDTFLPKPSYEAWETYQRRAKVQKLCNHFHVGGLCHNSICPFSHDPLEPEAVEVMKYILKEYPCSRKGKCRLAKCQSGHICQKDGCQGNKPCRLNSYMHNIDPTVDRWVLPDDQPPTEDSSVSDDLFPDRIPDRIPEKLPERFPERGSPFMGLNIFGDEIKN